MKVARRAAKPAATRGADPARTLAFLANLSQAFAVSLDLRKTLPEAIKRVAAFMRAEGASLFLLDPATQVLECRICVGPVDMTGVRLAIGQGVVGLAVSENATQVVADAAKDPRVWRAGDEASGFVTSSLLCVPLGTAAGPIGALELVNRRDGLPFSTADAEMLRLIAAPTSLAINNARMANDLVEQQRMKREFDLARKLQKSLLPKRRRGAFPVLGVNLPANEISGDFYDYFELADGRIGFVAGDISGKGLDAALLMIRPRACCAGPARTASRRVPGSPAPTRSCAKRRTTAASSARWSATATRRRKPCSSPARVFRRCWSTGAARSPSSRPADHRSASWPASRSRRMTSS